MNGLAQELRHLLMYLCTALLCTLIGCASLVSRRDCTAHPAVDWVFHAADEVVLAWHLYPMITESSISGGAIADGRVIVVCNLGGASEALRTSRVYVLDLQSGRVLKEVLGPTRTSRCPWIITQARVYFERGGHDGWAAFDLEKNRIDWRPPEPAPALLLAKEERFDPSHDFRGLKGGGFVSDGLQQFTWNVGLGWVITIERESMPGGWTTLYLNADNNAEGVSATRLCRFPVRPWGGDGYWLMVHDDSRLLFSWGAYLVSVDMGRLASLRTEPRAVFAPNTTTRPD